jgi:hypothetical protein
MALKPTDPLLDNGVARLHRAIRDMEALRLQSLELLAESHDLFKLIEKIDKNGLSALRNRRC